MRVAHRTEPVFRVARSTSLQNFISVTRNNKTAPRDHKNARHKHNRAATSKREESITETLLRSSHELLDGDSLDLADHAEHHGQTHRRRARRCHGGLLRADRCDRAVEEARAEGARDGLLQGELGRGRVAAVHHLVHLVDVRGRSTGDLGRYSGDLREI